MGGDLEAGGIDYSPRGIAVDARLRTSNKRAFAVGDVGYLTRTWHPSTRPGDLDLDCYFTASDLLELGKLLRREIKLLF